MSFEPKKQEKKNEEDIQQEIMIYFNLFEQLNNLFEKPYFIQSINGDIDLKSEELIQKVDENFKNKSNELKTSLYSILNQGIILEQYNDEFYNKFKEILENWITLYSTFD